MTQKHTINQTQVCKGNLSVAEVLSKLTFNVDTEGNEFSMWNAKQFVQGEQSHLGLLSF